MHTLSHNLITEYITALLNKFKHLLKKELKRNLTEQQKFMHVEHTVVMRETAFLANKVHGWITEELIRL